jgi:type I restriction enzyme R subunit
MAKTTFMGPDGIPISAEQFIAQLFDTLSLPEFFSSEEELRRIWSNPITRKALLGRLAEAGFGEGDLKEIQKLIDAENSDLFDVLEYVAFVKPTVSRIERALATRPELNRALTVNQVDFIHFVLDRYVATGVEELDDQRLPDLIKLKYEALQDGVEALGGVDEAREAFIGFQKYLYQTG